VQRQVLSTPSHTDPPPTTIRKDYNIIQASCSGKSRDRLIRPYKIPELCCNVSSSDSSAPVAVKGGRRALQQSSSAPTIQKCSNPDFPLLGQCQFTTGMIVYVSDSISEF